jgi:hypothetical protein
MVFLYGGYASIKRRSLNLMFWMFPERQSLSALCGGKPHE